MARYRMRASTKIALGVAAVIIGGYYGYQVVAAKLIDGEKFVEITPGRVNLVGVNTGAGYRIIVSNQMAQLVEGGGDPEKLGAGDKENEEDGPKKRIPLKELLKVLQGDGTALGLFVTRMNDELRRNELPANLESISWTPDQIRAAVGGDKALQDKLEHQLNLSLDGMPPPFVSVSAIFDGIYLKLPVTLTVPVSGVPKDVTGDVYLPYKPRFVQRFEQTIGERADEKAFVKGSYVEASLKVTSGAEPKEDVRKSLLERIEPAFLQKYTVEPKRVLANAKIVVNDSFLESANMETTTMPDGKDLYNLYIGLTDEGRRRLWQYSRHNSGSQLLLISDGAAVAAPRIAHELTGSDVSIKQLPDESLATEVRDLINDLAAKRAGK